MTPEKKPLSETAIDRKLDARIKELQEAQAKRDAEQDAKLARPSMAARVVDAPQKYPVAGWIFAALLTVIGCGLLYASVVMGKVSIYFGIGFLVAATCAVPGVMPTIVSNAKPLVLLWKSFRKNGKAE